MEYVIHSLLLKAVISYDFKGKFPGTPEFLWVINLYLQHLMGVWAPKSVSQQIFSPNGEERWGWSPGRQEEVVGGLGMWLWWGSLNWQRCKKLRSESYKPVDGGKDRTSGRAGWHHPQTSVCRSCCYVPVKSQGPELQWQETQLRKEEFTKDTRNKNDVTDAVWYHAISNIIILQRFYVTLAWFLLGLAFNISFEMFSLFLAPTKGRWETDS